MKSRGNAAFWKRYNQLPEAVQHQASKAYKRFKRDPYHPALHFKKVHTSEPIWAIRIGLHHRALGIVIDDAIIWWWIGPHSEYDKIIGP